MRAWCMVRSTYLPHIRLCFSSFAFVCFHKQQRRRRWKMCYLNRLTAQINKSKKDEDERNGKTKKTRWPKTHTDRFIHISKTKRCCWLLAHDWYVNKWDFIYSVNIYLNAFMRQCMEWMTRGVCVCVCVYARQCWTVCDYLIDVLNLLINNFGECERKTILYLALIELGEHSHTHTHNPMVSGWTDWLFVLILEFIRLLRIRRGAHRLWNSNFALSGATISSK